jgi:hypothetical protein
MSLLNPVHPTEIEDYLLISNRLIDMRNLSYIEQRAILAVALCSLFKRMFEIQEPIVIYGSDLPKEFRAATFKAIRYFRPQKEIFWKDVRK